MDALLDQLPAWVHVALRWFHVVAGITWIGQTYLFHFMESSLEPPEAGENPDDNVAGELWMVHGGGFYHVNKQKKPRLMPRTLHWFKYEALLTWISGVLLLVWVYYLGGLMVGGPVELGGWLAAAIGLGVLVAGFVVYDAACFTPLARNRTVFAIASFVALAGVIYGLHQLFGGRAAYIHVGALFGTVMVANVWIRILPGQRKMINAVVEGREPDMSYGVQGKLRSRHNSYLSIPLVFIMVSNHFPTTTYGTGYGWLVLCALVLVGWGAAWVFLFRGTGEGARQATGATAG